MCVTQVVSRSSAVRIPSEPSIRLCTMNWRRWSPWAATHPEAPLPTWRTSCLICPSSCVTSRRPGWRSQTSTRRCILWVTRRLWTLRSLWARWRPFCRSTVQGERRRVVYGVVHPSLWLCFSFITLRNNY